MQADESGAAPPPLSTAFVATRAALVGAPVAAGIVAPAVSHAAADGPHQQAFAAAAPSGIVAPLPVEAGEGEGPQATTRPVSGLRVRATAARSPVALAMHAIENGLHVAARLEALDDADRARLRDGIAALLARHGLAAKSIQINAPARRDTGEQRNYR
jgi:hypothetical protein